MKKLTAGIFATLLVAVSAGTASAEIASKAYVDDNVTTVEGHIGTLGSLTTSEKTNTVGAINELAGKITTLDGKIGNGLGGDGSDLNADGTLKDGVVDEDALDSELLSKIDGKQDQLTAGNGIDSDELANNKVVVKAADNSVTVTSAGIAVNGDNVSFTNNSTIKEITQNITNIEGDITEIQGDIESIEGDISGINTELAKKLNTADISGTKHITATVSEDGKLTVSDKITGSATITVTEEGVVSLTNADNYVTKDTLNDVLGDDETISDMQDEIDSLGTSKQDKLTVTGEKHITATLDDSGNLTVSDKIVGSDTITVSDAGEVSLTNAADYAKKADVTGVSDSLGQLETKVTGLESSKQDKLSGTNVKTDGNGNAVTAVATDANGNITFTKGATFLTAADLASADFTGNETIEGMQEDIESLQSGTIPKPSQDCSDATNGCVLTVKGGAYAWEAISR